MKFWKCVLAIGLLSVGNLQARSHEQPDENEQTGIAEDIQQLKAELWQSYRKSVVADVGEHPLGEKSMSVKDWFENGKLKHFLTEKIGEISVPYIVVTKGEKPEGGWPVFFCMHGGGQNPNAEGAHSWGVNSGEWLAQILFTEKLWDVPGIYIIPRMGDDRIGRWYHAWAQEFIERMIRRAILFKDANPNRVYLEGISEGGYGCYRLAAFMPDRFAAVAAMAAAEPERNAPPENLRNVAFRCGIGENDTMYDRIELARKYFKTLDGLAKADGAGYVHFYDEQKGRGHGIDYKEAPRWAAEHVRNPVPKKIVWNVQAMDGQQRTRNGWVKLAEMGEHLPAKVTAEVKEGNRIVIDAWKMSGEKMLAVPADNLSVYLDERLVDVKRKISVELNGKEVYRGVPSVSPEAIMRSTLELGDPAQVFAYEIKLGK